MVNDILDFARKIKRFLFGQNIVTSDKHAINHMALDSSDTAIARDIDYAIIVADAYLFQIRKYFKGSLKNKQVLEIGPGPNFGSGAILMCHGAKLSIADRWVPPYSMDYHPKFYAKLAEAIKLREPKLDVTPIMELANAKLHEDHVGVYSDAESLKADDVAIFDFILSNAVFEHIIDEVKACENLARISNPNSLHIHQIDLRDHSNFDKPLEYLLMSEAEYARWIETGFGHGGSARRRFEYEAAFLNAGLEVLEIEVNSKASEEYLADFIPRLRACNKSKYQNIDVSALNETGVRFFLKKKMVS